MSCIAAAVVEGVGGDGVICVLDDRVGGGKLKGVYEDYGWRQVGEMQGREVMGKRTLGGKNNWGGLKGVWAFDQALGGNDMR